MAIDPSILLQGKVANPLASLAAGYQLGNALRQQPMVDQMNQQKLEAAKLQNSASQIQNDYTKQKAGQAANDYRIKSAVLGSIELQNAPPEQWAGIIQSRIDAGQRFGIDTSVEQDALKTLNDPNQGPAALKQHIDALVKYGNETGITGTADLRKQEIELRRQALQQNAQQFRLSSVIQQQKIAQDARMMDLQDKRLSAAIDPTLQGDLSSAKSTGAATGKKGAERQAQWEDWTAFQGALSHVYPDIGGIMQSAPGSSVSQAVNTYGSKLVGGTDAYVAGKKISQLAAILMQQVPFPPGAQSEKEMEQRNKTLGAIEDPNISPADKLDMINKFLSMNEYKFKALAPKDGQQLPNGNVPPPAGMPATPENMNPNKRPPLSSFEGK